MDTKLFPKVPEDLTGLSDEEVTSLLAESEKAVELIVADDAEFLKGLTADEVIEQMEPGVALVKRLRAESSDRAAAHENYVARTAEIAKALEATEDDSTDADEAVVDGDGEAVEAEVNAEAEPVEEDVEETDTVEEQVLVTASTVPAVRYSRQPPAPALDRIVVETVEAKGAALVASGSYKSDYPAALAPDTLATLVRDAAVDVGPLAHNEKPGRYVTEVDPLQIDHYADGRRDVIGAGRKIVWDGPRTKVARSEYVFPEERTLNGSDDFEKIRAVLPDTVKFLGSPGQFGGEALLASGGICAPSTPLYSQVNFGTTEEPVWDSLPVFRAARGGVNVPDSTTLADITSAISVISEANDALGGTFATKSCQDLDCPAYTETMVNIFAHCREYGNLNARTWPEKIAHENEITMQALARTSEDFMLERIKALSVNVTNGVETLGALIYLVDAIVKSAFGIRGRLRMSARARFRALLPAYALDLLLLDTIQTQLDSRFKSREDINSYLRGVGIDPVWYIDGNFAAGDDQLPDASQAAGAIDGLPNTVQWALFPDGAFMGIDSGTLELGIVRDSTLNSTNDFQVFGERFRNLVRLAPAQACYWVTTDWCPVGQFPPAGTARTCE